MRILLALALIFQPYMSLATLNDVDKQGIPPHSVMSNGGFENGKAGWTASGGTFATTTTSPMSGLVHATWDSNGAGQTLRGPTITIKDDIANKNAVAVCLVKVPSGTSTHTFGVYDGTNSANDEVTLTTTADPVYYNFIAGDAGSTLRLEFTSVAADEPSITIDNCFVARADLVNVTSIVPEDAFSAKISTADAVTDENLDWIDGDCTDATTGEATCTFKSGIFSTAPNCTCTSRPGTSSVDNTCFVASATSSAITLRTTNSNALTDANITLTCQKSGEDTPLLATKASKATQYAYTQFDSTCAWTDTGGTYSLPAGDATCAFSTITSANLSVSSVVDGTGDQPAISFNGAEAGSAYKVCARLSNITSDSANLHTKLVINAVDYDSNAMGGAADPQGQPLCGIHKTSTANEAIQASIQVLLSAGTATLSSASGGGPLSFSVEKISGATNSVLVKRSVETSADAVWAIESAVIDGSVSPSTVTQESGDWINGSCTRNATGDYTCNLNAGIFSSTPTCYANANAASPGGNWCRSTGSSSTAIDVGCATANTTPSAANGAFNLICHGPR
jgi:hypothetical protein